VAFSAGGNGVVSMRLGHRILHDAQAAAVFNHSRSGWWVCQASVRRRRGKQIPTRTIGPSPERFLATFLAPKGCDCGPAGNEQSDWRSIERSRRHRSRISGYHGRSA